MYRYLECIIFWRRKGKDSFGKKPKRVGVMFNWEIDSLSIKRIDQKIVI